MADYKKLAKEIYDAAGGSKNIHLVNFCATRLRLNLNHPTNEIKEALEAIDGVMGVVVNGNQFQVVIGTNAGDVYNHFVKLGQFEKGGEVEPDGKKKIWRQVTDFIQGTFVPILPVLVAAGLVSAVLTILTSFFDLPTDSGTYVILNAINQAGFYYLPIFIGYSAARQIGLNPIMGMYLGAILVFDTINESGGLDFFGIPVAEVTYNNSVLPIILGIILMYHVDKFSDRISPEQVKFFTRPLLTVLITTPIVLIVLGPIGVFLGEGLVNALDLINNYLGWLAVGLVGAFTPILVMTGMNQTLFPVVFSGMSANGYDAFILPGMLAANVAVGGAALAVAWKTVNKKRKQVAGSSGITGVVGITEPALFGALLPLGKPLIGAIVGGAVGGLFAGLVGLKQYAVVSPGIAAIPTFIEPSGDLLNMWLAIITLLIALVTGFVVTLALGFDKKA